MKLPNAEKAIVELEKFSEYVLNPDHPTGRHTARVFRSVLGLELNDAAFLQQTVREIARTHDAEAQSPTLYGQRYAIDFELTTVVGTATVRTAWIIRNEEGIPRLTSCYVKLKGSQPR